MTPSDASTEADPMWQVGAATSMCPSDQWEREAAKSEHDDNKLKPNTSPPAHPLPFT